MTDAHLEAVPSVPIIQLSRIR